MELGEGAELLVSRGHLGSDGTQSRILISLQSELEPARLQEHGATLTEGTAVIPSFKYDPLMLLFVLCMPLGAHLAPLLRWNQLVRPALR